MASNITSKFFKQASTISNSSRRHLLAGSNSVLAVVDRRNQNFRFFATTSIMLESQKVTPSPYKPKFHTKDQLEFMKAYSLGFPAYHHNDNPDRHSHTTNPWIIRCSLAVLIPALIYVSYDTYKHEEWEKEHVKEVRPPFIKLDYMYIRRTPFPWGDGKTSLFHNPDRNPTPDGYET